MGVPLQGGLPDDHVRRVADGAVRENPSETLTGAFRSVILRDLKTVDAHVDEKMSGEEQLKKQSVLNDPRDHRHLQARSRL